MLKPTFYPLEEASTISGYTVTTLLNLAYEGKIALCFKCSEYHEMTFPHGCMEHFDKMNRFVLPEYQKYSAYVLFLKDASYLWEYGHVRSVITKSGYISKYRFLTDDQMQRRGLDDWFENEVRLEKEDEKIKPKKHQSMSFRKGRMPEYKNRKYYDHLMNGKVYAEEAISMLVGYWRIDKRNLFDVQSAIRERQRTRLKLSLYGETFPFIAECETVPVMDRLYIPTEDLEKLIDAKSAPVLRTGTATPEKSAEPTYQRPQSDNTTDLPTQTVWTDKESMQKLIDDWCEDLNLNPYEYFRETRTESLQSIRILAEKLGCQCTGGRVSYNGALLAVRNIKPTKIRELVRESFGLSRKK